ncbi:MAG TPA: pentapeptide repeat-containing protein [Flavobacteriales bacterium]|nr:pentapeptide repeat-containing protein [Flavobacteriales bacterium]HRE97190.1 pentapeptide repeat-containing protein [Flavobacteriales bacterium]
MMSTTKSIGSKIAEARKKKDLSQAELAQHVSISPQAVGKWERGESMPDITTLNRLADILGVDLNYFSEDFPTKEPVRPEPVLNKKREGTPVPKPDWSWDMSQGNWTDADFSGLKNLKEKFSSSNLKNCQFKNSELSGLVLGKNNIERCDFSGSDLRNSKIQSSNLLNNNFGNCSLIDTVFYKSNIEKCDFSLSDFSGAEITETNMENNMVNDVVWKFTKFSRTNISHMIFTGTIEDCHFEHCSFYGVKFENATILNTFFKYNERFKKVLFVNCKVDKITYAFLKNNSANLEGISIIEFSE